VPRYQEIGVRQSKARLDYDIGGSSARYGDTYSERLVDSRPKSFLFFFLIFYSIQHATFYPHRSGRPHVGYSSSRSIPGHDSAYGSSRHGMSYGGI